MKLCLSILLLSVLTRDCYSSEPPPETTLALEDDLVTIQIQQSRNPFEAFISHFKKDYTDVKDRAHRKNVFLRNLAYIVKHNKKKDKTFTMAINGFADLTQQEFADHYSSDFINKELLEELSFEVNESEEDILHFDLADLPKAKQDTRTLSYIDYRDRNCVTGVIDQGLCSSCWAFSTTTVLESANCLFGDGSIERLSSQQLIDCSKRNLGCRGGRMDFALDYVKTNGGLCSDSSYPYKGVDGSCGKCPKKNIALTQYGKVKPYKEASMKKALELYGPLAVAIKSASRDLQFYRSGIFNGKCGPALDHAVNIVGYGSGARAVEVNTQGQGVEKKVKGDEDEEVEIEERERVGAGEYWVVKNSWGSNWGERGYVRFPLGSNTCGISMDVVFPVVGKRTQKEREAIVLEE